MPRGIDDRVGEAHPVGIELRDVVRHHPFAVLREGIRSGEKGSGMTILPHSQQEKVMPEKALTSGTLSQLIFIFLGGDRWIRLAPDAKDVFRRNWGKIEKRFLGHSVIALIAVGGNAAFIAKAENPLVPGVPVSGEFVVYRPWGVSPTEAKMKFAAFEDSDVCFSFNERNGISDKVR